MYADSSGTQADGVVCKLSGLNLPSDGSASSVTIDGQLYYYVTRYNGAGDLYEYWYDADGNLIWARHHSDHKNPKLHKNPHDHEGTKDKKGNNTISKKAQEENEKFHSPQNSVTVRQPSTEEIIEVAAIGVCIGFCVYQATKWLTATLLAPVTGGTSYVVALVTP